MADALMVAGDGVLSLGIVRKLDGGYEMLFQHNSVNAAKLAGLTEILAIMKECSEMD